MPADAATARSGARLPGQCRRAAPAAPWSGTRPAHGKSPTTRARPTARTERAEAHLATLPPAARRAVPRESPQFTGRVIAALCASPDLMTYSGRALIGAELGAPPDPHPSLLG